MKVLFYVQHLLGIGHLARASLIAEALAERGCRVTMVMGGAPVPGFPGPGIATVQLAPLAAGDGGFSDLVDQQGNSIDDAFRGRRAADLVSVLTDIAPDVLLIEAFPFGRRQMRFELLPLLDAAQALPLPPVIACSLRDILQQRSLKRHRETACLVNRYFDHVLVHGDPRFAAFEETFPLISDLDAKISYTGVVSAAPGPLQGPAFDVVVSAGGGAAGAALMRSAARAVQRTPLADARWCVLTGPNLDTATRRFVAANAPANVTVAGTRSDFRALLSRCMLSVSQAGYNTMADVLRAGCRSLVVPFAAGGESEQTMRAERLAERGLVTLVREEGLTPENLAQAIDAAVSVPPPPPSSIDLDGAGRSAELLMSARK